MSSIPQCALGASGLTVSRLGLGCNRIGESIHTDEEWIHLLHEAADQGVTLFDTAAQYAGGRSEELIGKAFGNRDDVVIATKTTPVRDADGSRFTYESIIAGAERSLQILNRDCIDVFQTHGSGSKEEVSNPAFAEAMNDLRDAGKIRLRASATFNADGAIYAMTNGLVDALQITYSLIDSSHADPILPVADRNRVGLLGRMPYHRGSLTGKFRPGEPVPEGHRALLQGDRLARDVEAAERFRALGESRPGGMAELAMQFVLHETRITCTIPGARSIDQLRSNIKHALAPALTPDELEEIARIRSELLNL